MIHILIIEDEIPARNKLKRMIRELNQHTIIMAELDTVESAIIFLTNNQPDLIFSDIELIDGNAFEIYDQLSVGCPIIFTTAYDQFWQNAFESNGIDYLLKPYSQERFFKAWGKFIRFTNKPASENELLQNIVKFLKRHSDIKPYRLRFTIHTNRGIHFLHTDTISFLRAHEGVLFAFDETGKKHILSESVLKEIEKQLDPSDFFRINRSEIVHKKQIEAVNYYNKNALSVKIKGYDEQLITSQGQTALFRKWIDE